MNASFFLTKYFQPSVKLESKAGAYPLGLGRLLVLPAIIKQGRKVVGAWQDLEVTSKNVWVRPKLPESYSLKNCATTFSIIGLIGTLSTNDN